MEENTPEKKKETLERRIKRVLLGAGMICIGALSALVMPSQLIRYHNSRLQHYEIHPKAISHYFETPYEAASYDAGILGDLWNCTNLALLVGGTGAILSQKRKRKK